MDGKLLRKELKLRDISVKAVAEKFSVSRNTVYQYFDSEQLKTEIKDKFRTIFNIDIDNIKYRGNLKTWFKDPEVKYSKQDHITQERKRLSDEIYLKAKDLQKTVEKYDDLIKDFKNRIAGMDFDDPPGVNMKYVRGLFFDDWLFQPSFHMA